MADGASLDELKNASDFEAFAFMPGSTAISVQTPVLLKYTTAADQATTLVYHKALFAQQGWSELPDTGDAIVFTKDGFKIKLEVSDAGQGGGNPAMAGLGRPGSIGPAAMSSGSSPPLLTPPPGLTSGGANSAMIGSTGSPPPTSANSGSVPTPPGSGSDPRLPKPSTTPMPPVPVQPSTAPPVTTPPVTVPRGPQAANIPTPPPAQKRPGAGLPGSAPSDEMNAPLLGGVVQPPASTGSAFVTLTHLGNIDIKDVPTPRGLTELNQELESSSFKTRGNVVDFLKAIETELKRNRWKIVIRSQKECVARQENVLVKITAEPSGTRGVCSVQYHLEAISTDFPVLESIQEITYSEENRDLTYHTKRPRREIVAFYRAELAKKTWVASSDQKEMDDADEKVKSSEIVETFHFHNSSGDLLTLVVTGQARSLQRDVKITQVSKAKLNGQLGLDHKGNLAGGDQNGSLPPQLKMVLDGLVAASPPLPADAPAFLSEKTSPNSKTPAIKTSSTNRIVSTTLNGKLKFKNPESSKNAETTTSRKRFEIDSELTNETVNLMRDSLIEDGWKLSRQWTQGINENLTFQKGVQRLFIKYTDTGLKPTLFIINGVNVEFETEL